MIKFSNILAPEFWMTLILPETLRERQARVHRWVMNIDETPRHRERGRNQNQAFFLI